MASSFSPTGFGPLDTAMSGPPGSGSSGSAPPGSAPRAPDWIAAVGRETAEREGVADTKNPGWMSAFGLGAPAEPGGVREALPFGAEASAPLGEAPDAHCAEPESASSDEEAYMRGYAEGHAEAKRAGDAAVMASDARYRELRAAIRALDAAARDALTQDLNTTVLALCEQVLGDYALDAKALEERCRAAAKRLGGAPGDLTLHVHPATRARLAPEAFAGWSIEEDSALSPGALRLSHVDGAVRDGPEDWMRAFAEALRS